MARTSSLNQYLYDIAEAIRQKSGTSEEIIAAKFDEAIAAIPSGVRNWNNTEDISYMYGEDNTHQTEVGQWLYYKDNNVNSNAVVNEGELIAGLALEVAEGGQQVLVRCPIMERFPQPEYNLRHFTAGDNLRQTMWFKITDDIIAHMYPTKKKMKKLTSIDNLSSIYLDTTATYSSKKTHTIENVHIVTDEGLTDVLTPKKGNFPFVLELTIDGNPITTSRQSNMVDDLLKIYTMNWKLTNSNLDFTIYGNDYTTSTIKNYMSSYSYLFDTSKKEGEKYRRFIGFSGNNIAFNSYSNESCNLVLDTQVMYSAKDNQEEQIQTYLDKYGLTELPKISVSNDYLQTDGSVNSTNEVGKTDEYVNLPFYWNDDNYLFTYKDDSIGTFVDFVIGKQSYILVYQPGTITPGSAEHTALKSQWYFRNLPNAAIEPMAGIKAEDLPTSAADINFTWQTSQNNTFDPIYHAIFIQDENIIPLEVGQFLKSGSKVYFTVPYKIFPTTGEYHLEVEFSSGQGIAEQPNSMSTSESYYWCFQEADAYTELLRVYTNGQVQLDGTYFNTSYGGGVSKVSDDWKDYIWVDKTTLGDGYAETIQVGDNSRGGLFIGNGNKYSGKHILIDTLKTPMKANTNFYYQDIASFYNYSGTQKIYSLTLHRYYDGIFTESYILSLEFQKLTYAEGAGDSITDMAHTTRYTSDYTRETLFTILEDIEDDPTQDWGVYKDFYYMSSPYGYNFKYDTDVLAAIPGIQEFVDRLLFRHGLDLDLEMVPNINYNDFIGFYWSMNNTSYGGEVLKDAWNNGTQTMIDGLPQVVLAYNKDNPNGLLAIKTDGVEDSTTGNYIFTFGFYTKGEDMADRPLLTFSAPTTGTLESGNMTILSINDDMAYNESGDYRADGGSYTYKVRRLVSSEVATPIEGKWQYANEYAKKLDSYITWWKGTTKKEEE